MMGYYDLVLGLIPASFIGVTGLLHAGGIALSSAVSLGALVGVALVCHALFVRSPVDAADSQQVPSAD